MLPLLPAQLPLVLRQLSPILLFFLFLSPLFLVLFLQHRSQLLSFAGFVAIYFLPIPSHIARELFPQVPTRAVSLRLLGTDLALTRAGVAGVPAAMAARHVARALLLARQLLFTSHNKLIALHVQFIKPTVTGQPLCYNTWGAIPRVTRGPGAFVNTFLWTGNQTLSVAWLTGRRHIWIRFFMLKEVTW